jgi:hypothetical protein
LEQLPPAAEAAVPPEERIDQPLLRSCLPLQGFDASD